MLLGQTEEIFRRRKKKENTKEKQLVKSGKDQITRHKSAQILLRAVGLQDGSGGDFH